MSFGGEKYLQEVGNCEEELPKKPVGRQLTDSQPTVYRQVKKKEKLNS